MKKKILLVLVSLVMILAFANCDALIPQGLMGVGVTNLTNLELAGTLDVVGNTDLTGTLQYGANNLYPIGYASSGEKFIFGMQEVTTSETMAHGLTTVTKALCTLAEDPSAAATDACFCTVTVSGNTVTLKTWQDDGSTASNEVDVDVMYFIVGTP